jgi:hypothetical protein
MCLRENDQPVIFYHLYDFEKVFFDEVSDFHIFSLPWRVKKNKNQKKRMQYKIIVTIVKKWKYKKNRLLQML